MGLVPLRAGTVRDVRRGQTTKPAALSCCRPGRRATCRKGRRIFANLTVEENLLRAAGAAGIRSPSRASIELFPRLAERKQNRGRQLSGGEQEMLSIARALLLNPRLLILDEPSQGLAPLIVREVFRIVAEMRREGISVLLVEQNVRIALGHRRRRLCAGERRHRLCRHRRRICRPTNHASRRWPAPRRKSGRSTPQPA